MRIRFAITLTFGDKQRVRARYASRNETRCVGTIIAYSDRPMVCILTDDGEHVWWVADITDRLPAPTADDSTRDDEGES